MKKILGLATAALLATACAPDFRAGIPTKEMVELQLPQSTAQGLQAGDVGDAKTSSALQGQRSDGYVLTRAATSLVNGGTVWVLNLLEEITKHQPTTQTADAAVWGPYTDALSPNTFKLTVSAKADGSYDYALEGKAKGAPDTAYVAVLAGNHFSASNAKGHGAFILDWDKAATLPEHDDNVGSATIIYGNDGDDGVVGVLAHFSAVRDQDNPGERVNANYAYVAKPGVGGGFAFGVRKNMNPGEGTTLENFTIQSRWLNSGAGRSDAQVSGGDLGAQQATWNECWDTDFNSQFLAVSYDPSVGYGEEATGCAIVGAEYAEL